MRRRLNRCARWFLILLLLSSSACQEGERAPRRDFTTESLLMDDSIFPQVWENRRTIPTADSHGALEHLLRTAYAPGVVVVHEIYRYEFVNAARREYQRQLDVWFPDTPLYDQWRPREDLRRALTFADEAYVACANRGRAIEEKVINCGMVARYHEYIVRFSTQVVPPYLTFEDLARILSSLDGRFAAAMRPSTISRGGV